MTPNYSWHFLTHHWHLLSLPRSRLWVWSLAAQYCFNQTSIALLARRILIHATWIVSTLPSTNTRFSSYLQPPHFPDWLLKLPSLRSLSQISPQLQPVQSFEARITTRPHLHPSAPPAWPYTAKVIHIAALSSSSSSAHLSNTELLAALL